MTLETVARATLQALSKGDTETALSYFHPDCIWTIHVDEADLSFAGRIQGLEAIRRRLGDVQSLFEYLVFKPLNVQLNDDTVRVQSEVALRDRETATTFFSKARLIFQMRDGKVFRLDEHHDAAMLGAFMRLVELQRQQGTNDTPEPPSFTDPAYAPAEVARTTLAAGANGDVNGTRSYFAADCVYVIHIDTEVFPFAGRAEGLDAIIARLNTLQELFEYLFYKPGKPQAIGDTVRVRCEVSVRLKTTQDIYTSSMRLVMQIAEGKIVRLDEYHDAPMNEAYKRLADMTSEGHGEGEGNGS